MKASKNDIVRGQYPEINSRFRDVRIKHRLTQAEMGAIVGLASSSISSIEQGLYTPSFSVLRAVKKKFAVSYDYIIDGEEPVNVDASRLLEKITYLEKENKLLHSVIEKLNTMLEKS